MQCIFGISSANENMAKFRLKVLGSQITESVSSLLHTILLLRSTGKYHFKDETSYAVGSCGTVDVDCDFVDMSYTRADCDKLSQYLRQKVEQFSRTLRDSETTSGCIKLIFYHKNQKGWPFSQECIPWETWMVEVEVIKLPKESQRQYHRFQLGMDVGQKIMRTAEIVSRKQHSPREPDSLTEMDSIYDTSFPAVQPYLFKIDHTVQAPSGLSSSMKSYLWDSLAFKF